MANTYKNIVITPNIGNTSEPRIQFSGGNTTTNTDISLYVYPASNGTLSFEGSAGQLFSITNDLSNSLFSVNDVSGIPSIEVFANGLVSIIPISGNVVFGAANAGIIANTTGLYVSSNSTVNATHTAALLQVSNSTSTANLTALDLKIGATTVVNSTQVSATLLVGNVSGSYANITGQVNTATLYATTSANIASAVLANATGVWTTGTVNAASHTVGSSFVANSTAIVGTGFANVATSVNSALLTVGTSFVANTTGVYHTGTMNAASHTVGALFTANSTLVNAAAINITGQVNTATLYATTSANIASVVQANSLGIHVGANVYANTTAFDVGNTIITSTNAIFGGTIAANGGIGTAGQVLTSGAAGNAYWTTPTTGTVTSVASGNGITGGTITTSGTLYVVQGTGVVVNATGVHVNSTYIGTISSNNASYLGGTLAANYVQNTDSRTLSGNLVFSGANTTFSNKVTINGALNANDVTVAGNLVVSGTVVTVNAATLDVKDINITVAKGAANSLLADGGGLTVEGASATWNYNDATASWVSNLPIRVGTGATNVSINTTAFSGTSNNASYLGGTLAANYVQNTDSRTLSGNLVISGTYFNPSANTILLGNSIQRWVLSANSGDFSSTVNAVTSVNSALLTVGTSFIANTTGAYHTGVVNGASHTVGSSFIANSTAIVGTGFANITTSVNSAAHTVGTAFIANSTAIVGTGYANITTSVNSAAHTVGTAFIANATGVYHTGVVNAASHTVGSVFIANTTQLTTTVPFSANGSTGTSGFVLTSNGATGSPYWAVAGGVYATKSANYTAVNGDRLLCNTAAGTFTVTLPATPATGATILIYDISSFTTNPLTVARNASTIEGIADDFSLDIGQTRSEFIYDGGTWHVYSSIGPRGLTGTSAPSSVAYSIALA